MLLSLMQLNLLILTDAPWRKKKDITEDLHKTIQTYITSQLVTQPYAAPFADLLTELRQGERKRTRVVETMTISYLNTMRVSELRKNLDEKGLDIDGSREALIATLKESA